ncbi:hypothetical protein SAMN00790413_00413 [Deinococcus hopiensis KR-140]|uniref:Uncharacterized protein n=1 Tax=Deinococcus hopiensis KR-140 TaxID=695939 RepID=A0A1W1V8R8_9DEIO|nr:hypothetical protein SAMN00790413_00413 [Deinococcus hopiensis KR-140]
MRRAKAARIAAQEDRAYRTGELLPSQALDALLKWIEGAERDVENVIRMMGTGAVSARPLEHPAREAVCSWKDAFEVASEEGVSPSPPAGTVEYLEAEARARERALTEEASGAKDLRAAARWRAARFWFFSTGARVMGEHP